MLPGFKNIGPMKTLKQEEVTVATFKTKDLEMLSSTLHLTAMKYESVTLKAQDLYPWWRRMNREDVCHLSTKFGERFCGQLFAE